MTEQRPEFEEIPVVRLGHPADARVIEAYLGRGAAGAG